MTFSESLGYGQEENDWAIVVPCFSLIFLKPSIPSAPLPESITAIALSPNVSAAEEKKRFKGSLGSVADFNGGQAVLTTDDAQPVLVGMNITCSRCQ